MPLPRSLFILDSPSFRMRQCRLAVVFALEFAMFEYFGYERSCLQSCTFGLGVCDVSCTSCDLVLGCGMLMLMLMMATLMITTMIQTRELLRSVKAR